MLINVPENPNLRKNQIWIMTEITIKKKARFPRVMTNGVPVDTTRQLTDDKLVSCKLCKLFPMLADQKSGLFTGPPSTSVQHVFFQALVLGTIAEHSLPLSMAPVIMNTARELAKDPKALNHMQLERTTASYKMRFGLGKIFLDDTLNAM